MREWNEAVRMERASQVAARISEATRADAYRMAYANDYALRQAENLIERLADLCPDTALRDEAYAFLTDCRVSEAMSGLGAIEGDA